METGGAAIEAALDAAINAAIHETVDPALHPAPDAPFDGLDVLIPAREFKNRHKSILLTLEATADAMEKAERAACA